MKLINKLAIALVAAGSLATAFAESITFGVEIPPIASLVVRDGILRSAPAMQKTIGATLTGLTAPSVGGFTVITNMPKWNLYFSLANDGNLINQSGTYLKNSGGNYVPLGIAANAAVTPGQVWLRFPTVNQINGLDGPATTDLQYLGTSAVVNAATTDGIISNSQNTLTAMLALAGTAACTGPVACDDNGWIYGTDASTADFGVGTAISDAATIVGLAGTYTETLYITLVTAY